MFPIICGFSLPARDHTSGGLTVEHHLDNWEFARAKPVTATPGLLAGLVCSALGCLAVGALLGLYFGMNQVALF